MYELKQVGENSFYIESPARVGVVRIGEKEVCLIDGGSDKDAGRKIRQVLDKQGWSLAAIFNTHSHADHIGGNKYLQSQTGCRVFAKGIEAAFVRSPILEPATLYGGFPPGDLRRKFLLAQESAAEELTPEALPDGISIVPLPGHSPDMVGFRTADDVVYLADVLVSESTLNKYGITYLWDVAAHLRTLDAAAHMEAAMFVSAHAPVAEDISALAELNRAKVLEIGDKIVELCSAPMSFDSLLQRLFAEYGLTMSFEQHALVGSTVRSYLSWLRETGRVEPLIEDSLLLWSAVS